MEEKNLIEKYSQHIPGMSILFPIEDWHNFITRDGLRLHTYKYPAISAKSVLVSLHGLNSYSQPTGVIAKALAENGCEVLAFDFRGHGKSQGLKGYVSSIEVLVQDTEDFLSQIMPMYPGIPVFLMGGSLGGAVVLNVSFKVHNKIEGIILINPALGVNTKLEGLARGLSNCLASCCPTFPVLRGDSSLSTSNTYLQSYMRENPYYYNGKVRIGTSAAVLNAMKDIRKRHDRVKNKILLVQGNDDKVVSLEKVQKFVKHIQIPDKTLLMYPGRPHSIVFEDAVFDIANKIAHWVSERSKKPETNF